MIPTRSTRAARSVLSLSRASWGGRIAAAGRAAAAPEGTGARGGRRRASMYEAGRGRTAAPRRREVARAAGRRAPGVTHGANIHEFVRADGFRRRWSRRYAMAGGMATVLGKGGASLWP